MKNQDYRKLGEEAINGKFAELENNLWEEGWADNPMSYRPLEHEIYIEIMLRAMGTISLMYKDYDDFWAKNPTEEEAYKVAQPIFNKWANQLYPEVKLINGLNQELNYGKEAN
jgi:hypothetical protein|nr:MAG TPA: hypothetical protein [Caudoviricetes sp.]